MTDATLFDMQPIELPPDEGLSADARRTLRQKQNIANGYHPLLVTLFGPGPWAKVHPDAPDDTEPGQKGRPFTCGTCRWRQILGYHDRSYPKCLWRDDNDGPSPRVSHGAGTDVRAWWPACRDYTPGDPNLSLDAARWVPGEDVP